MGLFNVLANSVEAYSKCIVSPFTIMAEATKTNTTDLFLSTVTVSTLTTAVPVDIDALLSSIHVLYTGSATCADYSTFYNELHACFEDPFIHCQGRKSIVAAFEALKLLFSEAQMDVKHIKARVVRTDDLQAIRQDKNLDDDDDDDNNDDDAQKERDKQAQAQEHIHGHGHYKMNQQRYKQLLIQLNHDQANMVHSVIELNSIQKYKPFLSPFWITIPSFVVLYLDKSGRVFLHRDQWFGIPLLKSSLAIRNSIIPDQGHHKAHDVTIHPCALLTILLTNTTQILRDMNGYLVFNCMSLVQIIMTAVSFFLCLIFVFTDAFQHIISSAKRIQQCQTQL